MEQIYSSCVVVNVPINYWTIAEHYRIIYFLLPGHSGLRAVLQLDQGGSHIRRLHARHGDARGELNNTRTPIISISNWRDSLLAPSLCVTAGGGVCSVSVLHVLSRVSRDPLPGGGLPLELQTKVSEDYAKFYNHREGPTRDFSWFKAMVSRREMGTPTQRS